MHSDVSGLPSVRRWRSSHIGKSAITLRIVHIANEHCRATDYGQKSRSDQSLVVVLVWTVTEEGHAYVQLQLPGHRYEVRSLALSPDGRLLASGAYDSTMRLWDVRTGACLAILVHL